VSVGLTRFHDVSLTDAMRLADKGLYQAKHQSRNCVVCID